MYVYHLTIAIITIIIIIIVNVPAYALAVEIAVIILLRRMASHDKRPRAKRKSSCYISNTFLKIPAVPDKAVLCRAAT